MKEGWTYKKLGEVCNIDFGTRVVRSRDAGSIYPVYGGGGATFKMDTFNREDCMVISRFGMSEQCTRFVKGKFFLNDSGLTLSMKEECLIQPFMDWEILSLNKTIYSLGRGAAQKNLDTKALADVIISYPTSLSEQRVIVARLDSAFAHIDSLKANAERQLAEARKLFQKALEEAMTPKEGWEEKTIGDVAYFRNGIAHEKEIDKGGKYVVINSKFVSSEGSIRKYTNEQLSPLYKDDIVMVMSDVPKGKTLAKCYIVECDGKYSLNQRICSFKTKGPIVRFLYYMINRNPFLLAYDNGENQTNLRKKQILECPVAYPKEISEQRLIVSYLDALSSHVRALEENLKKTLAECDALKQAMLREVFE